MFKKAIFIGIIALGFTACENSKEEQQTLVHLDGRSKPQILLLDVIDHSDSAVPWDISSEFNQQLSHELRNYGSLYLKSPEDISSDFDSLSLAKKLQRSPFEKKQLQVNTEFLTTVEIIEHKITPVPQKPSISHPNALTHQLSIKARVKVFDIRRNQSVLILSEIIEQEAFIPWQLSTINYKKNNYKTAQYKMTPLGINHKQIVQNIAKKVHDYVLLAKSR
jgi:hypothetical protein